jgi:hypothetical protein
MVQLTHLQRCVRGSVGGSGAQRSRGRPHRRACSSGQSRTVQHVVGVWGRCSGEAGASQSVRLPHAPQLRLALFERRGELLGGRVLGLLRLTGLLLCVRLRIVGLLALEA